MVDFAFWRLHQEAVRGAAAFGTGMLASFLTPTPDAALSDVGLCQRLNGDLQWCPHL